MNPATYDGPGIRPEQLFAELDDRSAARVLPAGTFELLSLLQPALLNGASRTPTLGRLLSVELAVDDPYRRAIVLDALSPAKARELCERLGQAIDVLQTNDALPPTLRRQFLGFLGTSAIDDRKNSIPDSAENIMSSHALFPHQKRAASDVEHYLYSDTARVMLHLPTGVGKTRTAMSIIATYLRGRREGVVLWLAATRELLEQAAEEFKDTWKIVGDREVSCVHYWGRYDPSLDQVTDGIIIASLAKIRAYAKRRENLWTLGDKTGFVVFDEAHQAIAETYKDTVETIVTRNPRTCLLGLSATPGRTWGDPEEDEAVAEMFKANKVTLDFGGENPIRQLTQDGYLANVEFSLLNVEPGLTLTPADRHELTQALDIPDDLAARLGTDVQRNLRIIQRVLELAEEHSRVLVFAVSVENARLIASVSRGLGLEADEITGTTGIDDRAHRIARFKRKGGPHQLLVNFGVLTTGFDAPAASATLIARPTKSLVLYSQMVGRVIRGPLAGGTERCEVVTVVDTTLPGFGDVAEAFMNWEDIWTP